MDLSVIIVNYNVKYFLEQCLHAVANASKFVDAEVFVIDNNSVDGSCAMIRDKFPWVILIENHNNAGFSKANNQALRLAKGRYCLLLNPDTVIEELTFRKCITYMDEHPGAGALGVKMIDGKGNFLPESKRALPTPSVSFYKIFGLSKLFPSSRIFGKYHLGFLSEDEIHEVDVLSGAFMFLRKSSLDKTGFLDEDFFMYGEDIDLSYRMIKAGFKNIYFPQTTIIHYKGESTKKGSINYVLVFYNAMLIFARKHFTGKAIRAYSLLINMAVYFRAGLAIIRRFVRKIHIPLFDFILIFAGYWFFTPFWEKIRFGITDYYPIDFYRYVVPAYILIWLASIYYSGGYERPVRLIKLSSGHITGTIIILVSYALLPEAFRFSRALILLGAAWGLISVLSVRLLLSLTGYPMYKLALNRKKRMIIVGYEEEAGRVSGLLGRTQIVPEIAGIVVPGETGGNSSYLGTSLQLPEIVKVHRIDEIVFCARDISSKDIITIMTELTGLPVDFKIAPPESLSIIGSNSINTAGDLYLIQFNSIGLDRNRRIKRLFDIFSSLLFLLAFPLLFLFFPAIRRNFGNALKVLSSANTWIGFAEGTDITGLPHLKRGIFSLAHPSYETTLKEKLNMEYSRNYKISNDISILWRRLFELG